MTEEPGGLQSVGSHRMGHDWSDLARRHSPPREMQCSQRGRHVSGPFAGVESAVMVELNLLCCDASVLDFLVFIRASQPSSNSPLFIVKIYLQDFYYIEQNPLSVTIG